MSELRCESEQFHRAMPERMRKQHCAMSRRHMRSRDFEGAQAFVDSWHDLIERITSKRGELSAAAS